MAIAKLVPGKPTVTIEGLSYEAAQAVKVWLYDSVGGTGDVRRELGEVLDGLIKIKYPASLEELGLNFFAVETKQELGEFEQDTPF